MASANKNKNNSHASVQLIAALPKITIQYCTQCKWMLRAAYLAQELLSTFGTAIGEVALRPGTGGVFTVEIEHSIPSKTENSGHLGQVPAYTTRLWDRKSDGGFPETKDLKRKVRDVIDPNRDLGHVDRSVLPGTTGSELGREVPKADHDGSIAARYQPRAIEKSSEIGQEPGIVEMQTNCEDCG